VTAQVSCRPWTLIHQSLSSCLAAAFERPDFPIFWQKPKKAAVRLPDITVNLQLMLRI